MRPQDSEIKKFINKNGDKVFSDLSVENYDEIQILKVTKADKTEIPDVSIFATKGELEDTNLRIDVQESALSTVITDVDTISVQVTQLQGNVDDLDLDKADKDSVYTKSETNSLLNNKQDKGDYATNTTVTNYYNELTQDIDNLSIIVDSKANQSDTYTKQEVDDKVAHVTVDAYTKEETDTLLNTKASQTSLNQTNNNLDALTGDVENLSGELDGKQPKGDYALKSDLPTVPTKVSELDNDNNYTTEQEVAQMIASIPQFEVKIVQELPETGQAMVLYLVPKDGEAPDVYLEYIWIATTQTFELIGSTTVDLTDYVKNTDYASASNTGVIKAYSGYSTAVDDRNGVLYCQTKSATAYDGLTANAFIGKGTLENIKEDLVTSVGDTKYQPIGDYTTEQQVAQMIASIPKFQVKVVEQLPETGEKMVLYLVPKTSASGDDIYDEFIWIETTNKFEPIGSTTVDLTDYVKFTDYATATTAGVIRPRDTYGTAVTGNGYLAGAARTNEQYKNDIAGLIISKATLENIKEDYVTDVATRVIIRSW